MRRKAISILYTLAEGYIVMTSTWSSAFRRSLCAEHSGMTVPKRPRGTEDVSRMRRTSSSAHLTTRGALHHVCSSFLLCSSASCILLPKILALTWSRIMGQVKIDKSVRMTRTLRICISARSTPYALLRLYWTRASSSRPPADSSSAPTIRSTDGAAYKLLIRQLN